MMIEGNYNDGENRSSMENFAVRLTDPLTYDRLHTLSAEYFISVELLVNFAVKRLLDDVDFVRSLRVGEIKLE